MKTTAFKDRNDKIWDLKLTLGKTLSVDRSDFKVYTERPVCLTRFDGETIQEILTDVGLMFAVIGVIVRDQCVENFGSNLDEGFFQEKFADSIDGSCIEPARDALVEALADFFPAAKTELSTFVQRIRTFQTKIAERLPSLSPKIDQSIDQTIDRIFKDAEDKLSKTLQPTLDLLDSANANGS